jgi:signal transduction histidine kinase
MPLAGRQSKPRFFWQGVLIILPVVALSVVGLLSLRQDQSLAEHEARGKAQRIAEDLVPELRAVLLELTNHAQLRQEAFAVDSAGQVVFPPPYATADAVSPLTLAELSPEQSRLWQAAQGAETPGTTDPDALRFYRDFLKSNPPAGYAAAAQYSIGVLLRKMGHPTEAAAQIRRLLEQFPNAVGEAGLPLGPLAELQLFELGLANPASPSGLGGGLLDRLGSNLVHSPTLWTPHLLGRLQERSATPAEKKAAAKWQTLWEQHETLRLLFAATAPEREVGFPLQARLLSKAAVSGASDQPLGAPGQPNAQAAAQRSSAGLPALLWITLPPGAELTGEHWLAALVWETTTNRWFRCRRKLEVEKAVALLESHLRGVPDYFGVSVEVAGRKLAWPATDLRRWKYVDYMSKGGGGAKKEFTGELATQVLAASTHSVGGYDLLKVAVYLTSPETLFQHQRTRRIWFGLLIAVSAIAALAGLAAAYNAFRRQLRLSELKSNFVSSVSHELRAPIASVRLMAESLERGKVVEAPKQQQYFHFIVQECRRLSSLIENVLDFSRIEQGRKQYEFEVTDLRALAEQTVKLMEPYAAEKEVSLAVEFPPAELASGHPQVSVDAKAIQQALINLIDNALKHSPKGDTVTVGLGLTGDAAVGTGQSDPEPRSLVALWVRDQGPGIPPEEHEKIFERFYRCGSELRRDTQGVGIGLSIVRHVAEAHGGRVRVRSAIGQGSTFILEIPTQSKPCPANAS